jgi:hypothetical protein
MTAQTACAALVLGHAERPDVALFLQLGEANQEELTVTH